MTAYSKKEILVVVKTYPNPSRKYQETVCVAGVLLENTPRWIRIYPISFRDLPFEQQFKKFQVIEVEAQRNTQDIRPESYKVKPDSIKLSRTISTNRNWEERKRYLLPLVQPSMCAIQIEQKESHKSLGIFKPQEIIDFVVEEDKEDWDDSDKKLLSQMKLFGKEKQVLEKIPFNFKIHYRCSDQQCNGHKQTIIDWETAQLYRNLKSKYSRTDLIEKIRQKYLSEICGPDKDIYYIVGNQFGGPLSFLILGIIYPRKENNLQDSFPF